MGADISIFDLPCSGPRIKPPLRPVLAERDQIIDQLRQENEALREEVENLKSQEEYIRIDAVEEHYRHLVGHRMETPPMEQDTLPVGVYTPENYSIKKT